MSFLESIDFSKYGIQFDCSPDTKKLPESIRQNILPVVRDRNIVKFTKKDGSEIKMNLTKELGRGSYGAAWATDTEIEVGVKLIVKIISSSQINPGPALVNYEYDLVQEAFTQIIIYEATKDIILPDINLRGPFAPKLFLIGKDSKNLYIVSERLEANVADFLKNTVPTTDFIKTTIVHLSKILEILYDKIKFNHRDLKPDNIMFKMIDKKINVRLIDFGFSCLKYRQLRIAAVSNDVYASRLHCNSRIRDMHSFLYYLVNYTAYSRLRCPIKRLINALMASPNGRAPNDWANTYVMFNKYNSEGESNATLNCSYDVVHNIFLSIKFSSGESCSNINADWTKNLAELNINTNKFLTDEEYKNVRPDVLNPFLLPYLKNNLYTFWRKSSSPDALITEFKYVREVYSDTCSYSSTKTQCVQELSVPAELIPLLFDELIDGPYNVLVNSDKNNETILHKIARNKNAPNADKYLDRVLTALDDNVEVINKKSDSEGKTAYDVAVDNKYIYGQDKLIMYIDVKSDVINLKMLDTILEPDNTYFNNKTEAYLFILYNIIKANSKEYNERVDKFISKISVEQLKKIMFDNRSGERKAYTPLDLAILLNNVYVIRNFLQYDLPVTKNRLLFNISSLQDEELITKVLDKYMDASFINDYNEFLNSTPLINAVKSNNLAVVKKFIYIPNIKYSKQDKEGNTCLHYASAIASSRSGEKGRNAFEIIKLLLEKYPALADIKNKNGFGPGNPKVATAPNIRAFIKGRKSTLFKKNPNAEKNTRVRGSLGGRSKRKTLKRR
jgi:serine/threonine protein kinase